MSTYTTLPLPKTCNIQLEECVAIKSFVSPYFSLHDPWKSLLHEPWKTLKIEDVSMEVVVASSKENSKIVTRWNRMQFILEPATLMVMTTHEGGTGYCHWNQIHSFLEPLLGP
ncbi:hypothetical protein VIGAN_03031200 [Vigna angularis var. angularis]|uniref:Uncharacterized protein n=1 Tax=Vigna angularis var. angularis TaxID=157739 RepID=A0A0S3RJG8_PHAAN|nr:hypothetical protein VIGAN_03031200 [Vigna angularis var. angularis]